MWLRMETLELLQATEQRLCMELTLWEAHWRKRELNAFLAPVVYPLQQFLSFMIVVQWVEHVPYIDLNNEDDVLLV